MFLSADDYDVEAALDESLDAATIFPSNARTSEDDDLRIAFDVDAVIFFDEAERLFQEDGLNAFTASETQSARTPLSGGPLKNFLSMLQTLKRNILLISAQYARH